MSAQEKAAGVLDTPSTASQTNHTSILGTREADRKEYGTLQAGFALQGYTLNRSHRAHDDQICYAATRNGQSRYFTHLHDLQSFYTAVVAAKAARIRSAHAPTFTQEPIDDEYLD
jgi:hypothetical protein